MVPRTRRSPGRSFSRPFGRSLSALVLGGLALACSSEDAERPPSVLLISLDTLRADHLSCYGYGRETTPRLDALAAGATRFSRCVATAPWTVPSHASMMTGLFPSQHGAITADVSPPPGTRPVEIDNAQPLAPRQTTLAEVLREEGFATAAFVGNTNYLRPTLGISQGFDSWVVAEPWLRRDVSPAWSPWITASAIRFVEEHQRERPDVPFFLFLNYFDTHRPYNISPRSAHEAFEAIEALYTRVMLKGLGPGRKAQIVIEQFDQALSTLDASLGELFDKLREAGLFDDMLIIVTSDHGEYFGEHGLVEHSKDVYQEALDVPLIVKGPGQTTGEIDDRRASLVDIPRIVLAAMPAEFQGRTVEAFPYALGDHPVWAENHFSRPRDLFNPEIGSRFRRRRLALFEDDLKFIFSSDGQHELYDLASDAAEERDLSAERPAEVERLSVRAQEILREAVEASRDAKARELSADEMEMMEAAGYGGAAQDTESGG